MLIAVVMAATLAGSEETSKPLPTDIPANAVIYDQSDARKMSLPRGYYPSKALKAHADGIVFVDCEISNETFVRCAVLKETPPELGFGKATAVLFLKYSKSKCDSPYTNTCWKKFRYTWEYSDHADW